jgi:hypothetical protein
MNEQAHDLIKRAGMNIKSIFEHEAKKIAGQCDINEIPAEALVRAALDNVAARYSIKGSYHTYKRLRKYGR